MKHLLQIAAVIVICAMATGCLESISGLVGGNDVDVTGMIESVQRNETDVEVRFAGDKFLKGVILGTTNISSYVGHVINVEEDKATITPIEPEEIVIEKVAE